MVTINNFSKKFIFLLRNFLLKKIKIKLSNEESNKELKYTFIFNKESKQQQKRIFNSEKIATNNVNIPKYSGVDVYFVYLQK